jgi:photosystem II stability/assembly factor-like uncharacterized protein
MQSKGMLVSECAIRGGLTRLSWILSGTTGERLDAVSRSQTRRRRFALALILTIVSIGLETSELFGASWVRLDFTFTSVSFVTVDPKDSNTVYAGGDSGVFKSTDGGASWKVLPVGNAPLGAIALVVGSQKSTTLYAASRTRVVKSVDGGETWPVTGSGLSGTFASLAIDPRNDDTVYVGQECSVVGCKPLVFKSVDGGATFSPSSNALTDPACAWSVIDLAVDPTNSSTVYATTSDCNSQGGFLWKSVDGGSTWSPHNRLLLSYFSPIAIDPRFPSTLYAGPFEFGVSKSVDGGETWVNVSLGLPPSFSLSSLVIDPQFPSRLYAVSRGTFLSARGVFRSINGGASWTPVNDGLGVQSIRDLAISSSYPETVFAATSNGVFKLVEDDLVDSPHVGDFNADGKSDILWRSGERDPVAWLMNGTVVASSSTLPTAPAGWFTSGLGDFNGDGRADIRRRGTTGDVGLWLMDGASIASSHTLGNIWTGWTISGVGGLQWRQSRRHFVALGIR